jgi:tetratricopeptide (TPR) repeat protein
MAWRQVDAWRDTRALLEHAALVTRDNWLAHNDLGVEVSREGRLEEGRRHFDEALRIRPNYASPHSNLGFSYFFEGRLDEARDECERALEIQSDSPEGHFVLACVLDRQGDLDAARAHFERAIRIRPQYAEAHFRLGLTLRAQGRIGEARHHFEEALRLKPDDLQTELNLAALLAESSRSNPREQNEAVALLGRVAERMHDQGPTSVATLAAAFAAAGRFDEAVQWQARALAIAPDTLASNYRASLERYRAAATGSVGRGDPR